MHVTDRAGDTWPMLHAKVGSHRLYLGRKGLGCSYWESRLKNVAKHQVINRVVGEEESVPSVTISVVPKGAETFDANLADQLEWAGALIDQDRGVLQVLVETVDECNLIANALAAWIAQTTTEFRLTTKGPGGESELRMLRIDHVNFYISDMIAIAAFLK